MPRVTQRSIEAIKFQVNLLDVVSPYVQLKQAGRSWKGLSPFTQEKTPSFYVHPDRGFYKCFSSGEGGDLFSFIMKTENLAFIEAVEFIAQKFNVTLEYEEGGPSREEISLRKQLFDLHELAADWFHRQFMQSAEAESVRNYWTDKRGFDMKVATDFKIGYAPVSINALAKCCEKPHISPAAMHKSGLFFAYENADDYRRFKSRFRGRLMIPIRDVQGRVVAFTARQLPQTPDDDPAHEAKYINSPETPIFHKGRILFGMDHARTHLKEGDHFLLVEGQLDAIRCWTVGLHTAIAPQGTALTDEQLTLIRRYNPAHVECLLDGDAAGRKAALRYIPMMIKSGLESKYLLLPEKTDPDDLLKAQGSDSIDTLRKSALGPIELYIQAKNPDGAELSPIQRKQILDELFNFIDLVESSIVKEDYKNMAAKLLRVDPSYGKTEGQDAPFLADYDKHRNRNPNAFQPRRFKSTQILPQDPLLTQATWILLWLLFHFPEHGESVSQNIDYEWINVKDPAGRFLTRLLAALNEGTLEDTSNLEGLIDSDEDRKLLAEILSRDIEIESPKDKIRDCLKSLHKKYLLARKQELEDSIANADPDTDQLQQMREVSTIRRHLTKPHQFKI